jgi:hypothetical protein
MSYRWVHRQFSADEIRSGGENERDDPETGTGVTNGAAVSF